MFRLGLSQKSIDSVNFLLEKIGSSNFSIPRLHNILANSWLMIGEIKEAISHHEKALESARENGNERVYAISILNLTFCCINLIEFEEANKYLSFYEGEEFIDRHSDLKSSFYALRAYIASTLDEGKIAKKNINLFFNDIRSIKKQHIWGLIYGHYLIGMIYLKDKDFEKCYTTLSEGFEFAVEAGFIQLKAKIMIGIAMFYRENGDSNKSIDKHQNSLNLLSELHAKFDLAVAYSEFCITCQKFKIPEYKLYYSKAIDFFKEIEAEKQIDYLNNSFR